MVLFIPLLLFYLSATSELLLFLDLSETVEHFALKGGTGQNRLNSLSDLPHECHNCLVSHPQVSVRPAVEYSLRLHLEHHGRQPIPKTFFHISENLADFHTRSPPA